MKLYSAEEMSRADNGAQELGIPGGVLRKRAGAAMAHDYLQSSGAFHEDAAGDSEFLAPAVIGAGHLFGGVEFHLSGRVAAHDADGDSG